ncbi:substrate-binding domain-containing protein [Streptomyces cinereospinus]|uniref:Substrate-binding domain-containing protein n=1 Tax=Streptomyces cinereospinus TaxID=285561 RepID=A0ABV5NAN4_9ACTN
MPTIGATDWAGARAATEHLVQLGHRRIAHLTGPRQLLCGRARADGCHAAMEEAGLTVAEGAVRHGKFTDRSGHAATAALLETPSGPDGRCPPPCSPPATSRPSAPLRRCASAVCASPRTSAWPASTTCR